MTLLLAMAAAATTACAELTHFSPNEKWVKGDYVVTPVAQPSQAAILMRLNRRSFQTVNLAFAKAATGDRTLPSGKHYYLTKAAWFSPAPSGTVPGSWVKMGVDVDAHHVAYLTSFLLTHSEETSEFAAVLTSSIPLRGVVPLCRAAE